MKRAYFLEILESKDVRKKLLDQIDNILKIKGTFYMPRLKKMPIVPEIPRNIDVFKLPEDFNFEDIRNYSMKISDVKRILDGNYY